MGFYKDFAAILCCTLIFVGLIMALCIYYAINGHLECKEQEDGEHCGLRKLTKSNLLTSSL